MHVHLKSEIETVCETASLKACDVTNQIFMFSSANINPKRYTLKLFFLVKLISSVLLPKHVLAYPA